MTRNRARFLICVILIALAGCNDPAVTIEYKFKPGQHHQYRWDVSSTSNLETSSGITRRSVSAKAMVEEVVLEASEDRSVTVRTTITIDELIVDRLKTSISSPFYSILTVSRHGRVISFDGGGSLSDAQGVDLGRLIAEYRPQLPSTPVELGDNWSAPLRTQAGNTKLELSGFGRLKSFELKGRRRLARIESKRSGTLTTAQLVGRSEIKLSGTSTVDSESKIDLDESMLYQTTSTSRSNFSMRLVGGGDLGELQIRIRSVLTLI